MVPPKPPCRGGEGEGEGGGWGVTVETRCRSPLPHPPQNIQSTEREKESHPWKAIRESTVTHAVTLLRRVGGYLSGVVFVVNQMIELCIYSKGYAYFKIALWESCQQLFVCVKNNQYVMFSKTKQPNKLHNFNVS